MTAPTKRRFFRFSLRTMFILMTVAVCAIGWVVQRERRFYVRLQLLAGTEISYMTAAGSEVLDLDQVIEVDVGPGVSDDIFERVKTAFPDADVRRGSGSGLPMRLQYHTEVVWRP